MNHSVAYKLIYCITVFLFCNLKLEAFSKDVYNSDTLTTTERLQLEKATKNSFLGYYELADSFSKRRDSVNASKWLLKVDPYYFFFINQTPESIDRFLFTQFKLIDSVRRQYVQLFDSLYNAPKSHSYNTFKQMYDEDQQIRNILDKANDSFTYAKEAQRMRYTDSIHTLYLCNYLSKYGWPTIQNGSLYATLLAIHGHEHYDFYIPFMKKAILGGNSLLSALDLILYWKKMNHHFLI